MWAYGFRFFSLRSRGSFHISLTVLPLSVVQSCLALDGGPPCFPLGSSCPVVLWIPPSLPSFHVRGSHSLRRAFPNASAGMTFDYGGPQPQVSEESWFGLVPFRSPLLRDSHVDSSSSGYSDVSVRRVWLPFQDDKVSLAGLPHSDIHGSLPACRSPGLFAACRVLLRL